jgi:hypothetical protein
MMSDLCNRLRLSLDTPEVRLTDCDGRWRAYQHEDSGMYYIAAFTMQGDRITREIIGPRFNGTVVPLLYTYRTDAAARADRMNVRIW